MIQNKILGPWHYRRFMRWAGYFFRVMPWLWFGGIAALLAVSIFSLDKRYGVSMGLICALSIWPAIIGWLAINGFGIVWKLALGALQAAHRRQRPEALALALSISFLLTGVVFLGGAVMLLSSLLRRALVER